MGGQRIALDYRWFAVLVPASSLIVTDWLPVLCCCCSSAQLARLYGGRAAGQAHRRRQSAVADPASLAQLVDMGFPEQQVG